MPFGSWDVCPLQASWLQSETVEVFVGEDGASEKRYVVHKDVAINRCPYFKGCLSHQFKESQERKVVLHNTSTEAFDIVLEYIYTGNTNTINYLPRPERKGPLSPNSKHHIDAYILADRLTMEDLKNHLTNDIIDVYKWHRPDIASIQIFRSRGLSDSALERYLIKALPFESYSSSRANDAVIRDVIRGGGDLAVQLFAEFVQMTKSTKHPWYAGKCAFHTHHSTTECRKPVSLKLTHNAKSGNKRKRDT